MAAVGPLAAICLGLGTWAAEALGVSAASVPCWARSASWAAIGVLGLTSCVRGLRGWVRSSGRGSLAGITGDARASPLTRLALLALLAVTLFGAAGLRQAARLAEADRDADRAWRAMGAIGATGATRSETGVRLVEATVTHRAERAWGTEVELVRVAAADGGPDVPTRLRLRWTRSERATRAEALLWPGARVVAAVRIRPRLGTRNPGMPDRARADRRRGLAAEARLVEGDWVLGIDASDGRRARLARARAAIREAVRRRLAAHGAGAGLAAALAVGDRRDLAPETRDALRALGLSHLIAVSGLHVGLVGLGAATLVRRLFGRCPASGAGAHEPIGAVASGATAVVVAWTYGWLTGAAPAAQRAALALSGVIAARFVARPVGTGAALGGVACALLLFEPALVFDRGAQLSFAACFGLLRAMPVGDPEPEADPGTGAIGRRSVVSAWPARLARALRVSLGASFATAPIVASAGWTLALWGPVLNLVALPATAVAVLPAALIAAVAASVELSPLVEGCLTVVAAFEAGIRWLAAALASVGTSASPAAFGGPVWSSGHVLVASGIGLVAIRRAPVGALLILWVALAAGHGGPRRGDPGMDGSAPPRVVFLDVGQGDAALVQTVDRAYLVDVGHAPNASGAGGGTVARALRALGVRRLDALILSHGDADHAGGAAALLQAMPIEALVMPAAARADPRLDELARLARSRAVDVAWAARGDRIAGPGGDPSRAGTRLVADVLWPPGAADTARLDWNDRSLVLRFEIAGRRFLFTGDIGRRAESALLAVEPDLSAEVLKLPHHGSASAASGAFLAAVGAGHAVLSAPCLPSRGLPRREVLDRVVRAGARLRWTGRDGAIAYGAARDADGRGYAAPRPCDRALARR